MQNNCIRLFQPTQKQYENDKITKYQKIQSNLMQHISQNAFKILQQLQQHKLRSSPIKSIEGQLKNSQKMRDSQLKRQIQKIRKVSQQLATNQLIHFGQAQTPNKKDKSVCLKQQKRMKSRLKNHQDSKKNTGKNVQHSQSKIEQNFQDRIHHKRIHSSQKSIHSTKRISQEHSNSRILNKQYNNLSNIQLLKIHAQRLEESNVVLGTRQSQQIDKNHKINRYSSNVQYHLLLSKTVRSNRQKNKQNLISKKMSNLSTNQPNHNMRNSQMNTTIKDMKDLFFKIKGNKNNSYQNNTFEDSKILNKNVKTQSFITRQKSYRMKTDPDIDVSNYTNSFTNRPKDLSKKINQQVNINKKNFQRSTNNQYIKTQLSMYNPKCKTLRYNETQNEVQGKQNFKQEQQIGNKSCTQLYGDKKQEHKQNCDYMQIQDRSSINKTFTHTHNNFRKSDANFNENQFQINQDNFYIVNNQFVPFGNRSVLDKNRQNIKKIGKNINRIMSSSNKNRCKTQNNQNRAIDQFIKTKTTLIQPTNLNQIPLKNNLIKSFSIQENINIETIAKIQMFKTGTINKIKDQDFRRHKKSQSEHKTIENHKSKSQIGHLNSINASKFYKFQRQKSKDKSNIAIPDPHLKTKSIQLSAKNTQNRNDIVIICM